MSIKFKSVSWPKFAQGADYKAVKRVTVPNQAMSLHEILTRFTRGEEIPVGQPVAYSEVDDIAESLNVDIEKIKYYDLVDRAEFSEKLNDVVDRFKKQETRKKQKADREAADAAEKLAAEMLQKRAEQVAAQQSAK